MSIRVNNPHQAKDEVSEDRIASMVFDLGNADTLVISGKSVYPYRHKPQMDKNNPQIRAVIGGTGKYIGARGQIATTRNDDETYTHLIELVDQFVVEGRGSEGPVSQLT